MSTSDRHMRRIAGNIPGAEGPVVDLHGRFFMVCPKRGQVLEIREDGQRREVCQTAGIPAGLQVDRDNVIWIADMKRGILTTTAEGELTSVIETFEGQPMRGCNDCYFDSNGNLYFTAPAGSGKDAPVGELYCLLADRKTVRRLDDGYRFCNGLAVTADDGTLIVAETYTKKLWAYDLPSPGVVKNKRLWATLPEGGIGGDGMDFDSAGNLLCTHPGAGTIDVFSPNAKLIDRVQFPVPMVTNCHFNGPDSREVWVTVSGEDSGLWKFTWERTGQRQYCDLRK